MSLTVCWIQAYSLWTEDSFMSFYIIQRTCLSLILLFVTLSRHWPRCWIVNRTWAICTSLTGQKQGQLLRAQLCLPVCVYCIASILTGRRETKRTLKIFITFWRRSLCRYDCHPLTRHFSVSKSVFCQGQRVLTLVKLFQFVGRESTKWDSEATWVNWPIRKHYSHQLGQSEKHHAQVELTAGDGYVLSCSLWTHWDGIWNESRLFSGRGWFLCTQTNMFVMHTHKYIHIHMYAESICFLGGDWFNAGNLWVTMATTTAIFREKLGQKSITKGF